MGPEVGTRCHVQPLNHDRVRVSDKKIDSVGSVRSNSGANVSSRGTVEYDLVGVSMKRAAKGDGSC